MSSVTFASPGVVISYLCTLCIVIYYGTMVVLDAILYCVPEDLYPLGWYARYIGSWSRGAIYRETKSEASMVKIEP